MDSGFMRMRERASRVHAHTDARARDPQACPAKHMCNHTHAPGCCLPTHVKLIHSFGGATRAKRKVWAHRP
eukprot:2288477-Alexandrium_andersonii.AAC.1